MNIIYIYIHPLVICYIANWKDPPCFMGKSTISTGPCSIAMFFWAINGIYPLVMTNIAMV